MHIVYPKLNTPKFLLWSSFVVSIIVETFVVMGVIPDSKTVKIAQYVILLIPAGIAFFMLTIRTEKIKKRLFWRELKFGVLLSGIFFVLTMYRSISIQRFSFESIMEIFQIVVPFIFAFIMINEFSLKEIETFMKIAFCMTTIGYIFVILPNFKDFTNLFMISVVDSYSPFEDSSFAEIANGLSIYFIYNRKKTPYFAWASVILNLFIFKRVFMLMVLVLLLISLQNKQDNVVDKNITRSVFLGWVVIICFTFRMYQPESTELIKEKFNIDIAAFTRSRIYRLWYMIEDGFVSYGLGSTSEYIYEKEVFYLGHEFEMDFIRIMYEIGTIAIITFVYVYLKITKNNKYTFWMMNFCFLNLLMANGILRYWGWLMRFIAIAVVNYGGRKYNNACYRIIKG